MMDEKILYFYCRNGSRSGINVNGIELISKMEFIKKAIKIGHYDRLMILKPEVGNRLINWGKDITEEDLKIIFKGAPTYQREIILGYSDYNPWVLKKDLHLKYGKDFGPYSNLLKNKDDLLLDIETLEELTNNKIL